MGEQQHHVQVVTGTCHRQSSLQQMIESARAAFAFPELLSFIVVDCGGDPGTERYCRSQADVLYVNQNARLGAISAFNLGCSLAGAEYVLLANDDVVFEPDSITSAWRYLEDDAGAGAVAFMDNRPHLYKAYLHGDFGVALMSDDKGANVVYAQVGLFRRWLGDLAGWWGRDDALFMANAHTYGGDNYLSARIYELGYRIEIVQGARVHDLVLNDTLRAENYRHDARLQSAYYTRYPKGFHKSTAPRVQPSQAYKAALRTLYLPIYEPGYKPGYKRGLRDAFARVGLCVERDYVNKAFDLVGLGKALRPDLLFIQLHSAQQINQDDIRRFRAVSPETVIVTWNGDVYEHGYTHPDMLRTLAEVDLALGVNADALEQVERETGTPARYWQISFEPALDHPLTEQHEIVFLGNRYQGRDALDAYLQRRGAVVVGSGWSFPTQRSTTYDFQAGRDWYRQAKAALGDNVHGARGFVSNRMFEALAAGGALYFQQTIPDLENLTGLRDGTHYIAWSDFDDLDAKLDYWLAPKRDTQRRKIAQRAADDVRAFHSFDARVEQLWHMIREVSEVSE